MFVRLPVYHFRRPRSSVHNSRVHASSAFIILSVKKTSCICRGFSVCFSVCFVRLFGAAVVPCL